MGRKLKRSAKGQTVTCKICGRGDVPIGQAREDLTLRARTASASGTLTHVRGLTHLGTWTCDRCETCLEMGLDPKDPKNAWVEKTAAEPQQQLELSA